MFLPVETAVFCERSERMTELWNLARIQRLIADSVSESIVLEYKQAESLNLKDDHNKLGLAKDVSSMANSAGGTIIYGLIQAPGRQGPPVPIDYDMVPYEACSAETLENVLTSWIQPPVDGLLITPISRQDGFFWVIEVPEGVTAHQVLKTCVYYYRRNFKAEPMPDYMVRQVMNRGTSPRLGVVVTEQVSNNGIVVLSFAVENQGTIPTRGWALQVDRPPEDDFYEIGHVGFQQQDMRLEYMPAHPPGAGASKARKRVVVQVESSLFPGQARNVSKAFDVKYLPKQGIETLEEDDRVLRWVLYSDRQEPSRGFWDPLQLS